MSFSPVTTGVLMDSPEVFTSDIRCKLESQYNDVRDSIKSDNMQVYARIRPMLPHEETKGFQECIAADDNIVRVRVPPHSAKFKSSRQEDEIIEEYTFTAAFPPDTGQFVFFQETMLNTMQNFIEGSNSLVFSYGITGSGKTFTLQGNSNNPGIIPLSLKLYFAAVEKQLLKDILVKPHQYSDIVALSDKDRQQEYLIKKQLLSMYDDECDSAPGSFRNYNSKSFAMSLCEFFSDDYEAEEQKTTLSPEDMAAAQAAAQLKDISRKSANEQPGVCSVWVSFVEIYNENIFDLLQPFSTKRNRLNLGEDINGNVYVKGVREINVSNSDEALKLLNLGRKQLSIASTKMNYQSSRSHCIYTMRVVRVPDPKNISYGKVSRLSFCDLAGSERASKTQTTGTRLKEAGAINTSLLVLGRCLEQLRANQMGKEKRMIPFRESKLTRIFSSFFLGQGKAVMIANASPCDYTFDETLHVLKFSAVAKKLLVNDTFLMTASRTLQSFNDQWQLCKANSSMSFANESLESVDSDSDIIQMKDVLIEKLLAYSEELGKELGKVKKQNVELEMKIRQEVCEEYSEYSDQLFANQRLNHEQELTDIIDSYKTRLSKMEIMYEKIIKGYKDQLGDSETDESFAETSAVSLKELNDSHRKSLTKNLASDSLEKNSGLPESNENADFEALEKKLSTVTNDLEKAQRELSEIQKMSSNLEIELSISKAENQKLTKQCVEYESTISELTIAAESHTSELKSLGEKLVSTRNELNASKEKVLNVAELESEIEVYKKEIQILKKSNNDTAEELEKKDVIYKALKEQLSSLQKEIVGAKEESKFKSETVKNLQSEMELYKKEMQILKKNNKEIAEEHEKKTVAVKALEGQLSSLQKELEGAKEKSETIDKLHSEIEVYKKEIQIVKKSNNEITEEHEKKDVTVKCLNEQLSSLQKELVGAKEESEYKSETIDKLESEIEVYIKEIQMLKKGADETTEEHEKKAITVKALEEQLSSLQKQLVVANEESEIKSKKIGKLQSEIEVYKNEIQILKKSINETTEEHEKKAVAVKALEEQLSSCHKELVGAKEEIEIKLKTIDKLQSEMEVHKKEIQILKKSCNETSEEHEKNVVTVRALKEQLSSLQKELVGAKEDSEIKSKTVDKLQSEMEVHKKEIEILKKSSNETSEEHVKNAVNVRALEEQLFSLQKELVDAKEECENKSKSIDELQSELGASNEKQQKLLKQCDDYQNNLTELIANHTTELKCLEKKLVLANGELDASREQIQLKEFNVCELETEMEVYKNKIELLTREINEVKEKQVANESDIENYKQSNKALQDRLSTDHVINLENEETEKTISELRKELEVSKKRILELKRSSKEISNIESLRLKELGKCKERVHQLELELESSNKTCDSVREDLKIRETVNENLEKEIENFKERLHTLKSAHHDAESKLKFDIKEYKETLWSLEGESTSLKSEISAIRRDQQIKAQCVSDLENEINSYKLDMETLLREKEKHESERSKLKADISKYESAVSELELELASAKSEIKVLKNKVKEKRNSLCELEKQLKVHETKFGKNDEGEIRSESGIGGSNSNIKLEKELSSTCEELESTKINLQMKSLKIADLEAQLEGDKKKMEKYKHETKKSISEKSRLIAEVKTYEAKIKELEEQLFMANTDNVAAREKSSKKIDALETEIKSYLQDIERINKELDNLQSQKLELASQLSTYKRSIEELETSLTVSKQENLSLKDELTESRLNGEKISVLLSDIEERFNLEVSESKRKSEELQKKLGICEEEKVKILSRNEEQIKEIEKNLSLADLELKSAKSEVLQKCKEVKELKDKVKYLASEISRFNKLQKEFEAEKSELNIVIASSKDQTKELHKKLSSTKETLYSTQKEIAEKLLKIKELEEDNLMHKSEVENYVNKTQLEESTFKSEVEEYRAKLESVKEELQFTNEKLHIQSLSCKELEGEVSELKVKLEEKTVQIENLVEALKEAKIEIDVTKTEQSFSLAELSSLQNLKKSLEEKHSSLSKELASLVSGNKSLKDKLSLSEKASLQHKKEAESLSKDIQDMLLLNDSLEHKVSTLESTKTDLAVLEKIVYLLEDVEMKATHKVKKLCAEVKNKISEIEDVRRQLKQNELNIEDMEKALCQSQQQIKEIQVMYDKKLISEKEQHTVEIEQTMALKHLVEEDNKILRSENLKLKLVGENAQIKREKSKTKMSIKIESPEIKIEESSPLDKSASPKIKNPKPKSLKDVSQKVKNEKSKPEEPRKAMKRNESISSENLQKTSRSVRQKQQNIRDISFSSITSEIDKDEASDKVLRDKGRKRASDTDFEQPKGGVSKKMKSSTETKTSKSENLSRKVSKTSSKQSDTRTKKKTLLKASGSKTSLRSNDSKTSLKGSDSKTSLRGSDSKTSLKGSDSKTSLKASGSKTSLTENVARSSRRLQTNPGENLSPVQKMASRIGAKFKSVCERVENVSKNISSPRIITRGKRKLFNPEVPSSSTKDVKVTRARKMGGK